MGHSSESVALLTLEAVCCVQIQVQLPYHHTQNPKSGLNFSSSTVVISGHTDVHAQSFSCVQLFTPTWTAAHEAPLSMEFSKQEN